MNYTKIDLDEFAEQKNLRFEFRVIDEEVESEDDDGVVAMFTSHIDAAEVAGQSDNLQALADEYLINEYFESTPDYDEDAKQERVSV